MFFNRDTCQDCILFLSKPASEPYFFRYRIKTFVASQIRFRQWEEDFNKFKVVWRN